MFHFRENDGVAVHDRLELAGGLDDDGRGDAEAFSQLASPTLTPRRRTTKRGMGHLFSLALRHQTAWCP